jgi:hypothetical protein
MFGEGVGNMIDKLLEFSHQVNAFVLKNPASLELLRADSIGESIQLHHSYSPILIENKLKLKFNKIRLNLLLSFVAAGIFGFLMLMTGSNFDNLAVFGIGGIYLSVATYILWKLPPKFALH